MSLKQLKPQIKRLRGFTDSQAKKFYQSALLCVEAMNTKEFEHRVKNFKWSGGDKFKMVDISNAEVYEHIMSGKDKFGWPDGDVDIDATLYFGNDDTIGYTYATSVRTWINKKFFFRMSHAEIAGNICHEYLHNCGYNHSYDWNDTIVYTAPYAVGYMVVDIAKEIYQPSKHSPMKLIRRKVCSGWGPWKKCWYEMVDDEGKSV